ncbi:hypothetical protein NRB_07600 [Novosphingobium sp. 11B]
MFLAVIATVAPAIVRADAPPPNPLVGTYHLIKIDEPGPDGNVIHHTDLKGSLIYAPTGRMSVQVMYPDASASNEYTSAGYEGSFGSYTVDTRARRVTHHVEGANARKLVGSDLPRSYQLTGDRLVIRSTRPDEHWAVTWQRY